MSSQVLDIISPPTIGEDMIGVSIDPVSLPLLAGQVVTLDFDYSVAAPAGVLLPLKLIVQPAFGDGTGYFEKVFKAHLPVSYAFTALGAGQYLAVLKEMGHNFWQGRLLFTVVGETFNQVQNAR